MLPAAARIAVSLLIVSAAVQGVVRAPDAVNFFSFFTVLSNLFAAAVLLIGGLRAPRPAGWELVRGAAVVYMVTTGIVYAVLLSGAEEVHRATPGYLNWVMHRVAPLFVALDWLFAPPRRPLPLGRAMAWLAFPLAYAAYSLLRGEATDWYPYPFLDVGEHGYGAVLANCAGIAAFVVLLSVAVAWIGGRELRRSPAPRVS